MWLPMYPAPPVTNTELITPLFYRLGRPVGTVVRTVGTPFFKQTKDIRFECTRCGSCCTRPGPVYFSREDLARAADFLGLTPAGFRRKHIAYEDEGVPALDPGPESPCTFLRRRDRLHHLRGSSRPMPDLSLLAGDREPQAVLGTGRPGLRGDEPGAPGPPSRDRGRSPRLRRGGASRRRPLVSFAEVAIPVPLRQTFTYRIPETYEGKIRPGFVVKVPFGARTLSGFVVELSSRSPVETVKDISEVMEDELSIPPEVLDLCRWVSGYYLAPLGEVLRTALPSGLGKRSPGDVPHAAGKPPTIELDAEQAAALDAVTDSIRKGDAASFLLFGVTGSGKTEVYLRAAQETVASGERP